MLSYICLDTETTGLSETDKIVQISWITKINDVLSFKHDYIIKVNEDVKINNSHIHNITYEISQEKGKPLEYVLYILKEEIETCKPKLLIGHNIMFDKKMLINNIKTLNDTTNLTDLTDLINSLDTYCTMLHGKYFLKQKKYPKLQELYFFMFQEKFENAHNSLYDVQATCKCYEKLKLHQHTILEHILNKIITFGKYKSKTIRYVYDNDIKYLTYFIYNTFTKNKEIWQDVNFIKNYNK